MTRARGRTRGQSEVLGTALLLGIVVLASLAVAGLALGAFGGTQDQAEDRAIEQMLLDLRSAATDVGLQGVDHRSLRLEPPGDAQVSVNEDAGSITITHKDYDAPGSGTSEVLYNSSLGAVEVSEGDATYAFEGGGVFRKEGDYSRLVAAPPIAYRGLTANIPVIKSTGEGTRSGPLRIGLSPGDQRLPAFPNSSNQYDDPDSDLRYDNPITNGTLEVEVQSKYYRGWYQFFTQRTTGSVTLDAANESVIVELESVKELNHHSAITYSHDYDTHGNPDINGEVENTEIMIDSRSVINSEVENASDSNDNEHTNCIDNEVLDAEGCDELQAGTYYVSGDTTLDNDLAINTSDGDVKLILDGDLNIQNNEIHVTDDTENVVKYYVNGSFTFQGNARVGTDNEQAEAYRNAFLVADGVHHDKGGGGTAKIDAIIYAPNAEIDIQGNFELNGALYAKQVDLGSSSLEINYDPSVEKHPLDLTAGPTPVMFLHVTQNDVVVSVS